jgi:hypothetical protein
MLNVSKVLPQPKILNDPAGALDRGPRGVRKNIAKFLHCTLDTLMIFSQFKKSFSHAKINT